MLNKECVMILKGVLLLLVLSTSCGCVYRRCDYIVREIEPCGFDLHRKQVKVRGVFTRKDRSFIFDELVMQLTQPDTRCRICLHERQGVSRYVR